MLNLYHWKNVSFKYKVYVCTLTPKEVAAQLLPLLVLTRICIQFIENIYEPLHVTTHPLQ